MEKINNINKRENKQLLLKEAGFRNIQDAKKSLGMEGEMANAVYEQLMENHNTQVIEIRKNKQKEENKKNYAIQQDVKRVKSFNENDKAVTIRNITPKKLKKIIASIDTTKRTTLKINGKYFTLTPEKQAHLLKNEDKFFVQENTEETNIQSDAGMTLSILNFKEVVIERPKWKGKSKNEGAFFKYYHNTLFDLDEFAIHQNKQEEYNENCFVQALISLGVDESIITDVRKIICSKYLPTNKLTKIAERFNLYIRVKTLDDHKDTKNFGKKGNQEILLGLIDQHYFAIKKVDWTSYAVKNYFEICKQDGFKMMYKNGNKISKDFEYNKCTTSWETIKYMYENQENIFNQNTL